MKSKGEAIRAITAHVNDSQHNFCKYAEDFTLFELGSWDDSNCIFDLLKTPYSLGVLIEFRKDDPSGQISRVMIIWGEPQIMFFLFFFKGVFLC